jgi:hypothetical protein
MKDVLKVFSRSPLWTTGQLWSGRNFGKDVYHLHADSGLMSVQWHYQICGEEDIVISINYEIGNGQYSYSDS